MRREICFEVSKERIRHMLQLRPVPNTPKYQIFVDGSLKYMGAGFRLDECVERLSFFERSGFDIKMLSRSKEKELEAFKKASDDTLDLGKQDRPRGPSRNGKGHRPRHQEAFTQELEKTTNTRKPNKSRKMLKRRSAKMI